MKPFDNRQLHIEVYESIPYGVLFILPFYHARVVIQ